jgi:hypothetical protein
MHFVRKKHPAADSQSDSKDQYRDASDHPPTTELRARLQRLQIVAQFIIVRFRSFRSGLYPPYFRNEEPIASLWNRLDIARIFGVIVQRLPKLANRHPKTAIEIDKRISRPETISKFLAADDFTRSFEEDEEEPIGLLLQPYRSPVLEKFARGGVYLKRAESIDGSWMCLHTWAPQAVEDR